MVYQSKQSKKKLKGWGMSLRGHTKKYKKYLREELEILEKKLKKTTLYQLTFWKRKLLFCQKLIDCWRKRSYAGIKYQTIDGCWKET